MTWGEIIKSRLLAEYRSRDVPVQRLRPAIVALRGEFGRYPLAHARPFLDVDGRELVRVVQDRVGLEHSLQLVVVRNGQLVLAAPAAQFQSAVGYADDVVVVAGALRSVVRRAGDDALTHHWAGSPEGLALVRRLAGLPAPGAPRG